MSKQGYFSLKKEPDLKSGFEFTKPDKIVVLKLRELLTDLSARDKNLVIEPPLKEKKLYQYLIVEELINKIMTALEKNYSDYSNEFETEPLNFKYVIGKELFFKDAVDIVQIVSHSERDDIGKLYYSLSIKFSKGKYYYWSF